MSGDHQSKLTLMSESLRNDGRVWVPKKTGDQRSPDQIPEAERDYYLERRYPSFGNLVPRDVASRAAKQQSDEGHGVGETGLAVYLDFKEAIQRLGVEVIKARYGNLFEMYERITADDPYKVPMRIYPAIHYTMGGLWVDYNLESTIPGLFVLGEANFSDHGANRVGASALVQGLADGYFIAPYAVADYLAGAKLAKVSTDHEAFRDAANTAQGRIDKVLGVKGKRTVRHFHRQLGRIMWDYVGMARSEQGLKEALGKIRTLRDEFWQDVVVPGEKNNLNPMLDYAGRVADYMEFGELLTLDALHRNESCGGHFREEFQTPDGEALRDDANYSYVAALELNGVEARRRRLIHTGAALVPMKVHPSQRSSVSGKTINRQLKVGGSRQRTSQAAWSIYVAKDIFHRTCPSSRCSTSSTNPSLRKGEDACCNSPRTAEGFGGACRLHDNSTARARARPGHRPPGSFICAALQRRRNHHHRAVRAPRAFPVLKDLTVDRSAFDRIVAAGGYISAGVGGAQDANNLLVPKDKSDAAMDSAACIGCGACVAACKNAAAHLFTSAKVTHLALLPQGEPERRYGRSGWSNR